MVQCDSSNHECFPECVQSHLLQVCDVLDYESEAERPLGTHLSWLWWSSLFTMEVANGMTLGPSKNIFVDFRHTWWFFCHRVCFDCVNNLWQVVCSLTWISWIHLFAFHPHASPEKLVPNLWWRIPDCPKGFGIHWQLMFSSLEEYSLACVDALINHSRFSRTSSQDTHLVASKENSSLELYGDCTLNMNRALVCLPSWSHSENVLDLLRVLQLAMRTQLWFGSEQASTRSLCFVLMFLCSK